jgi:arylsulfatase A-like enzyme
VVLIGFALGAVGLAIVLMSRLPLTPPAPTGREAGPRNFLLITIDTLRADHVGIYGHVNARTPAMDALARRGVRFTRAYATAPITLTSHASLLTGRDPPGHGARHNGIAMRAGTPTLATILKQDGFRTGAFVSAFPLDRRFGLTSGFDAYDDAMPRAADGRPANERPGSVTVDRAIAWLTRDSGLGTRDSGFAHFMLWVHLFEPHAPYGPAPTGTATPRDVLERYDDEIATADREIGRLLGALPSSTDTLVVVTGDHGEAFGEHEEIGHSIFVYDTTLRVPLIMAGPGIPAAGTTIDDPVTLADIPPTVLNLLGAGAIDADGIDLRPALEGHALPSRALYAESFAPLVDFGWAALRSMRRDNMKFISAPRPELYDLRADGGEQQNVVGGRADVARDLAARVDRISSAELPAHSAPRDRDAVARLRALGYTGMGGQSSGPRPDPKDRIQVASRIAAVTSGELHGEAAERALLDILRDDPKNPQAHVRLGYVMAESGRCAAAEPHFAAAIAGGLPSADPYLGLALCLRGRNAHQAALDTLRDGQRAEPGNPVVDANIGLIELDAGRLVRAVAALTAALDRDPDLHAARFALARALARLGRREEARRQATELLSRLPVDAPQRAEVERLVAALR